MNVTCRTEFLMQPVCKVYFASQLEVLSTAQLDEHGSKEAIFQHEHKTEHTFSFGFNKLQ
jgi:hypothetical protein